jgi:hypothetical protein
MKQLTITSQSHEVRLPLGSWVIEVIFPSNAKKCAGYFLTKQANGLKVTQTCLEDGYLHTNPALFLLRNVLFLVLHCRGVRSSGFELDSNL